VLKEVWRNFIVGVDRQGVWQEGVSGESGL